MQGGRKGLHQSGRQKYKSCEEVCNGYVGGEMRATLEDNQAQGVHRCRENSLKKVPHFVDGQEGRSRYRCSMLEVIKKTMGEEG